MFEVFDCTPDRGTRVNNILATGSHETHSQSKKEMVEFHFRYEITPYESPQESKYGVHKETGTRGEKYEKI